MIEWFLTGYNAIGYCISAIFMGFMIVLLAETIFDSVKFEKFLFNVGGILVIHSLVLLGIFAFSSTIHKTGEWSTVYQKGDDKTITITLNNSGTITNDAIGNLYRNIDTYHQDGTISVDDKGSLGQYAIVVEPENIIANKKLNEQSKLVKIEYRKYESQHRELFGFKGHDEKPCNDGELRLTFDDGDDSVKKLFKH